ncbi:GNAT family N-acetyltransferase [Streptomonospora wellingtoniae]|uniref:GNAT family N-acetyltransferase n=1 Tax=Streptomonospora wellingtoniae TaxID=3075544 RepID=A0ABU2KQ16_9ACTN|nr:GNAT family N-acetyltransferase [Streptomonospora sp. DSM 45055]MDT0301223.1 GNAT family N-acetyltransferase [Streptomonospora sp. DSM 45055]
MSFSRESSAHEAEPDPVARWDVRVPEESELPAVAHVVREAMLIADYDFEEVRESIERDRALAAFDGARPVGTAGVHSFTMTMPGGPRRVAAVTGVGVWPTRRRRGVLSALMSRQLADIRDRGEDVAALFASEGGIYGRFGYGPAAGAVDFDVHTREAALRPDAPRDPALRLRLAGADDVRKELEEVHKAAAAQRVGEFQRSAAWWDKLLRDKPEDRRGQSALRCAVAEDDAGPLGYVLYRTTQLWSEHGAAEGGLRVKEVYATAPAAATMLWEHVLTRDLVLRVSHDMAPPDDPLFHLLADPYRARRRQVDNLWIRLVDLPAALEKRTYAAPVDAVIEVGDRHCPWNAGRWRLSADTTAARCTSTEAAPDVSLDVAHLGAAYLGDTRLGGYLAAGLIREATPGAVHRLDTALHRSDRPHCGNIF